MKNIYRIIALFLGLGMIISACSDPEESLEWRAGEDLRISRVSGTGAIPTLSSVGYYVQGFTINENYEWNLEGPSGELTVRRDGEFADVFVEEPGTYTLTVDNGTYSGSTTIIAESVDQELGFESDSISVMEIQPDTVMVPVTITERNPAGATVEFSVDATGTAEEGEGQDFLLFTDSPLVFGEDEDGAMETTKYIKIVVLADAVREDPAETIVLTLDDITETGEAEYEVAMGDETEIVIYIQDDIKVLSFEEMETDTLTSETDAGNYVFNVNLSGAPNAEVTVPYTVSGTGVSPLVGNLTFTEGTTSQPLPITISNAAFADDQEITISLGEPISDDEEVLIERDEEDNPVGNEITIVVDVDD